jgi:hypothetical protein
LLSSNFFGADSPLNADPSGVPTREFSNVLLRQEIRRLLATARVDLPNGQG